MPTFKFGTKREGIARVVAMFNKAVAEGKMDADTAQRLRGEFFESTGYYPNYLDKGQRGQGNAVSRRLGYEYETFRCYCEYSPCNHEHLQGTGYYRPESEYQRSWQGNMQRAQYEREMKAQGKPVYC